MDCNLLIDELVKSIKIGGAEYEINSNFRTSLLFTIMIQDNSLEETEKALRTLDLYYDNQIPAEHIEEAIEKALWFYRCGKEIKQSKGKGKGNNKKPYSFEEDDNYIFAAFLSQYRIDLNEIEYLHWWKFKALFESLTDDNKIMEIMKFRCTDLKEIKDKEQQKYYKSMQELYELESDKEDIEEIKSIEEELLKFQR